ncbi:MAG: FAD-dependent oxidoreductase [Leptospiraceae bacterium]|nr:FAD-dependent oxidoreductase [Leptospiraceae bacterium]MCP5493593.1 FAD-dependent oxidoreductase [Leptospiraceae bacterium]
MAYDELFQPIKIGSITLPNRMIMGSMHLGLEGMSQTADRMIAFYGKRFDGGIGLITTGGIGINEPSKGSDIFFNFQKEEDCKELEKVATALKPKGIFCAQLFHAGRYAYNRNLVAPSAIRAPINRFKPKALTEEEAWQTIEDFAAAAVRAREVGFGAVEVMGSEGYLINQFLSPVTNQRTDYFGGTPEKRMNFGIEVMKKIREKDKTFPVIYRMSGIDLIPGNPPLEEVQEFARKIRDAGADALNIGIGWHESRIPTISMLVPRGSWGKISKKFKEIITEIPIIASNRINKAEVASAVIKSGEADIVSMARPLLADPFIVQKIKTGQEARINTCIACNQACLDHAFNDNMVSCLVNPEANRELEYAQKPKGKKSKVVIVGAGPAGMETARVCATLGHETILIEQSGAIGGQLHYASSIPGKFEFKETIRYFTNELKALNVDIRLNTKCDMEMLDSISPDAVVFCTGVVPREVKLPGLEKKSHGNYVEYLTGKYTPGKNVAIIGGGGIACDSAHKLVEEHDPSIQDYFNKYNVGSFTEVKIVPEKSDRKVSILRRAGKVGAGLGATTGWALLQELQSRGVEFYTGLQYKEVTDEGLVIESNSEGQKTIPCDSVLVCAGQEKEDSLAMEYQSKYPNKQVFIIGGAKDPSRLDAKRAIYEGGTVAREIGL